MRVRDLINDAGVLTGFTVSHFLLWRWVVPKIVHSIPGATLIRKQRPFRLAGPDEFCEFVVDGKTFLVIEPYGDNDHFMVVAEPPERQCRQIQKVREAFSKHRVLFGLLTG